MIIVAWLFAQAQSRSDLKKNIGRLYINKNNMICLLIKVKTND